MMFLLLKPRSEQFNLRQWLYINLFPVSMSTHYFNFIGKYMKTQEAIDYFGSLKKLADALGVWPQVIYGWGEYPPKSRQYELEVKTNGELKAEVE